MMFLVMFARDALAVSYKCSWKLASKRFYYLSMIGQVHCPFPASGDDKVYHMPVSRAEMRTGGLVCIILFEHGVGHYHI